MGGRSTRGCARGSPQWDTLRMENSSHLHPSTPRTSVPFWLLPPFHWKPPLRGVRGEVRMEKPSALVRGQRWPRGPWQSLCPAGHPCPCREGPGGCAGSVHVEREAVRAGESKQLHQAQAEGWFEDEVVASSRSALDLHHVWNVRNLQAGGEGRGWGRWRCWGAEGRGCRSQSQFLLFFCFLFVQAGMISCFV